jgi:hypothetical protein
MLRRLRQRSAGPMTAGGCLPARDRGTPLILAALIAATCLAALQLAPHPNALPDVPGFVADALGDPREGTVAESGWRTFEHGISRRTAWGHESIAYHGARPGKFLTVSKRQGVRVWRWRLAAHEVGSGTPVARVLDAEGRSLAQAELSWLMTQDEDGWLVHLRVVDTNLPLPYVLEPMTTAHRGIR